jgi:uracil-DNA glycosylase
MVARTESLNVLLREVRACTHCVDNLPLEPRPVVKASRNARILIIGQAPGLRVHETGIAWNDASGDRLRGWLGVDSTTFASDQFATVPMGFCYPGRGRSGDLPPRPECAPLWHPRILPLLVQVRLTLLVGAYAQARVLGDENRSTLTETVRSFRDYLPRYFPLPHPSPRNAIWQAKNKWFERDCVRALRVHVHKALQ